MAFERTLLVCCTVWIGLAQAAAPAGGSSGKLYRWVDEHGHVQYGDTLPANAGVRGSAELGKTGQVMKRSESEQERKARLAAEAQAAKLKKQKDEQNRQDEALLATYSSEKEIDLARNRALEFHQMAIESAQIRISQVAVNQKAVTERALGITKQGKPIPRYLQRQLDANQAELDRLNRVVKDNQDAMVSVKEKFDADKKHFRELTAHP